MSDIDNVDNKKSKKESVVETPTPEVPEIIDTYTKERVYKNIEPVDIKSERAVNSVIMPSGSEDDLRKLIDATDKVTTKDLSKELSEEGMVSIGTNYESSKNTPADGVTSKRINEQEFVNNVKHAGKHIGIREVNVNTSGRLSGGDAVARFTSGMGIGKHTTVTLWHSGFSLTLAPPKESDIINLQYSVAKVEYQLGMETNNFIYSNYGVVINKLLTEFILAHVVASSLTIPDDGSYLDYIKLTDLNALVCGMITSIHPKGYPVTVTCKNSLLLKDNKPICDFTATADVVPDMLLWVNRKVLTTEGLAHISKTSPNSHTVNDVLAYQNGLKTNLPVTHELTTEHGQVINLCIKTPTLRTYLDAGELWVNGVITGAQELFTDDDNEEARNAKIDTLVLTSILNKYNGYITSLAIDDSYVDDQASVMDVLEVMSSDSTVANTMLKHIINHIDDNYVSLVATYNFDCPKCKEAGRDPEQAAGAGVKGFKEFVPLNAVEHFFDLSTLKYTQIVLRNK